MDKNAIKKYAVWARNELIARVSQKAQQYGITAAGYGDKNADSVNGVLLSVTEKKQRQALISKIDAEGFEQVMEEVAYTWFNRFTALRFMEVNNYLPSHIRVFTNEANEFKPQILADAISLELEGLDMDKVFELKNANKDEELYKYLLIVQCNALSSILPGMFQKIADYTELLLPDYLLRTGSVVEQLVTAIPEEDWNDQVQIIGWLYQYYNIEPKANVFGRAGGTKIKKEEVPAATQLFTPDWIVRYMVENSLGKLWEESHGNAGRLASWKYFVDEEPQDEETEILLKKIRSDYQGINPENIKCIDPCAGSGHILCYMFDVLVEIYEQYGFTVREAVRSIVEKNIYGLDIDERAAQLSYFAIMMKACQYGGRRFFNNNIQPNVMVVRESNDIDNFTIDYFCNGNSQIKREVSKILDGMRDAKEYGSLSKCNDVNFEIIYERFNELESDISIYRELLITQFLPLVKCAEILSNSYDVVITNPPYMAVASASPKLSSFINKKYPDSKGDLFAVFIERCKELTKKNGFQAMITMHSWMFLSSFEKLREKLCMIETLSMIHLGAHAFEEIGGEVVQTTSFVFRNANINGYKGTYCRLLDPNSQDAKEKAFLSKENRFCISQSKYQSIPGSPVAYWVSEKILDAFINEKKMEDIAEIVTGMSTGKNDLYLRMWHEVGIDNIAFYKSNVDDIDLSVQRWVPYNKGGEARKWYGNNDYVVKWSESANFHRARPSFAHLYLKQGITWSFVTSGMFSARYYPDGFLWDVAGCPCVIHDENLMYYALGYLSSKIANRILKIINPTINCQVVDVQRTPIILSEAYKEEVITLSKKCIAISKRDWDSFENSWDFEIHPLIEMKNRSQLQNMKIEDAFAMWSSECQERFAALKQNEERLNEIFIDIFRIDDMDYSVEDDAVTVRKADRQREIKSLISYAVGCMFGRYSLNRKGVFNIKAEANATYLGEFSIDGDNVIPINDDEYFSDDIVARFIEFIKIAFGEKYLDENIEYIARSLEAKGNYRDVIRKYFISGFYADHVKKYQKRPIYWLFDSGKKNGFKCLIYMHRYQADTIARIRTDYVHELQSRYRTSLADLEVRISNAETSERVKLSKIEKDLRERIEEIRSYEEKIHHLADMMISLELDDGVKKNYDLFKDVLAKL